mmetsp:Transcript_31329/g.81846  ORF Transcript_31329/g.81846 Transcript_31329/m.81846 type:complete len:88 (+) Transcript_31329:109-372(+)
MSSAIHPLNPPIQATRNSPGCPMSSLRTVCFVSSHLAFGVGHIIAGIVVGAFAMNAHHTASRVKAEMEPGLFASVIVVPSQAPIRST